MGTRVDATSYGHATGQAIEWAHRGQSRYVCLATVNNVMEAYDSAPYRDILDQADLVTPDGMPLVWMLRALGVPEASRVYGPDLTPLLLKAAADHGIPVGFYGGTQDVLDRLKRRFQRELPRLQIVFMEAPPFREPTPQEAIDTIRSMQQSGARILFVGLGSPKQDLWMHHHRGRIPAVMLGVGAAFDFLAGVKRQAPRWMMRAGLEWLFRLATEPRRLARRYLKHNPRFVFLALRQLLHERSAQS